MMSRMIRARLAITTHLARIAQQRPLDQITDEAARRAAQALRSWFTDVFLHAEADVEDDLAR
jgi:hypothetical protein